MAVSGCSGPSAFSRSPARARKAAARPRGRPGPEAGMARLLRLVAVVGMLGAERLLADRQRPLEERPRAREVALVLKQGGEVVEARRGLGMLGAERLLGGSPARARTAAAPRHRPRAPRACTARARLRDKTAAVSAPFGGGSAPPTRSSAQRVEPPRTRPSARVVENGLADRPPPSPRRGPAGPPRPPRPAPSAATVAPGDAAGSFRSLSTDHVRRRSSRDRRARRRAAPRPPRRARRPRAETPAARRIFARLREQEKRDRLGREQRRVERSAARRAGCSLAASSMARANAFATVRPP